MNVTDFVPLYLHKCSHGEQMVTLKIPVHMYTPF